MSHLLRIAMTLWLAVAAAPSLAQKTNQPVYQDPFDLGGGGASLTRASRDGRIFANPALLPYGGRFHRWFGNAFSILANSGSLDIAKEGLTGVDGEEGSDEESGGEDGRQAASDFIDRVFEAPVRVGWANSLSWVTNNFGLSAFTRFEPDFRAREIGETGVPEVRIRAESYNGVALGLASRVPGARWLSLGVTAKHIYAAEPDQRVEITDAQEVDRFRDPAFVKDLTQFNVGTGMDVGALMFFQGRWLDYSLALKMDDVGNTRLVGESKPAEFKQVASVGTGLTLHGTSSALHMAIDYRDVQNAYGEKMFKRIYAGTKLTLFTYLGLSTGYHHGYPSYGAELDFIFLRITGTYYVRELGANPGVDPRRIYMATVSLNLWPF